MTSKPRMIDPPYLFSSEDVLMNLMKYEHDWLIFHPKKSKCYYNLWLYYNLHNKSFSINRRPAFCEMNFITVVITHMKIQQNWNRAMWKCLNSVVWWKLVCCTLYNLQQSKLLQGRLSCVSNSSPEISPFWRV